LLLFKISTKEYFDLLYMWKRGEIREASGCTGGVHGTSTSATYGTEQNVV
jgi:hypothetical protein